MSSRRPWNQPSSRTKRSMPTDAASSASAISWSGRWSKYTASHVLRVSGRGLVGCPSRARSQRCTRPASPSSPSHGEDEGGARRGVLVACLEHHLPGPQHLPGPEQGRRVGDAIEPIRGVRRPGEVHAPDPARVPLRVPLGGDEHHGVVVTAAAPARLPHRRARRHPEGHRPLLARPPPVERGQRRRRRRDRAASARASRPRPTERPPLPSCRSVASIQTTPPASIAIRVSSTRSDASSRAATTHAVLVRVDARPGASAGSAARRRGAPAARVVRSTRRTPGARATGSTPHRSCRGALPLLTPAPSASSSAPESSPSPSPQCSTLGSPASGVSTTRPMPWACSCTNACVMPSPSGAPARRCPAR